MQCTGAEYFCIHLSNSADSYVKSIPESSIKSVVEIWTSKGIRTYYNFGSGYILSTAPQISTLDSALKMDAAEVKLRHISMVTQL